MLGLQADDLQRRIALSSGQDKVLSVSIMLTTLFNHKTCPRPVAVSQSRSSQCPRNCPVGRRRRLDVIRQDRLAKCAGSGSRLVGRMEKQDRVYTFALNMDMRNAADAGKRLELGKSALKALGVL